MSTPDMLLFLFLSGFLAGVMFTCTAAFIVELSTRRR